MWLVGLAALGAASPRAFRYGFLAMVAVNAVVVALKRGFRRARPAPHVENRFLALAGAAPDCDRYSFPSGHAANAFALAAVLAGVFPGLRTALWLAAAAVGGARVLLGNHYASDMVAGAVIGTAVAVGLRVALGLGP